MAHPDGLLATIPESTTKTHGTPGIWEVTLFCVQGKKKPMTNPTSPDLENVISTEEGKQMDTLLQKLSSLRKVQLEAFEPRQTPTVLEEIQPG